MRDNPRSSRHLDFPKWDDPPSTLREWNVACTVQSFIECLWSPAREHPFTSRISQAVMFDYWVLKINYLPEPKAKTNFKPLIHLHSSCDMGTVKPLNTSCRVQQKNMSKAHSTTSTKCEHLLNRPLLVQILVKWNLFAKSRIKLLNLIVATVWSILRPNDSCDEVQVKKNNTYCLLATMSTIFWLLRFVLSVKYSNSTSGYPKKLFTADFAIQKSAKFLRIHRKVTAVGAHLFHLLPVAESFAPSATSLRFPEPVTLVVSHPAIGT